MSQIALPRTSLRKGRRQWAECYFFIIMNYMVNNRKRLPDSERCQTEFGGGCLDFSYCQVESPDRCRYAVRSASFVVCLHPDRRSFEKPRKTDLRISEAGNRRGDLGSVKKRRVEAQLLANPAAPHAAE